MKKLIIKTFIFSLLAIGSKSFIFGQCEELIWADEFDSVIIDSTKWTIVNDNSGGGNAELQYYTDREENINIVDGNLIIKAMEENYQGREYTSALIETEAKADWRYGRFETRMKLPYGQGIWPAFWMLPSESVYGGWPDSGEIDIMELVGHEPNRVYGTLHSGPPWVFTNGMYNLDEDIFNDDFHTFSIEWDEDTIKWFVDDNMYSYKTVADVEYWNVFQEKFYLIINLAVGGNWPGSPDESTQFPQTLEVDYVRVYGKTSELEITQEATVYPNGNDLNFYISNIPDAQFNWTIPADANIISGQGTNLINVEWGCAEGDVSVEIQSVCGNNTITKSVVFDNLQISGDSIIYENSQNIIFEAPNLHGSAYTWNVPDDVDIVSQDSNKLVVNWGCSEGNVSVEISNDCINETISLPVKFKYPKVQGPESVPENALNIVYTIEELPNANYVWSVPEEAEITSGQGTNTVSISFGMLEGYVSVDVSNNCNTSTFNLPVSIGDALIYCSFEGSVLQFGTFSGSTFEMIENPYQESINISEHVGKTLKSTVTWAGIYADLGSYIDFSTNSTFKVKVYGPKTGTILFKLEKQDEGSVFLEETAELTLVNQWEELNFDFSEAESNKYDRIALFFDFGSADENYFYFDDIKLSDSESRTLDFNRNQQLVKLFPNPAISNVELQFENSIDTGSKILIYGRDGRKCYEEIIDKRTIKHDINIENFIQGIYIIQIVEKEKITKLKLIVS